MFSTNFSKTCCSFEQNKIVEKSTLALRWRTCCETTVAIEQFLIKS